MNKISVAAARAFMRRKPFKRSETQVVVYEDGTSNLLLFNNKIAVYKPDGRLYITYSGWPTRTTTARLNSIPSVSINRYILTGKGFSSVDWILYSNIKMNGNDYISEIIFKKECP